MTARISIPALREMSEKGLPMARPYQVLALVEAVEAAHRHRSAKSWDIDYMNALDAALARFDFGEDT